MYSVVGMMGAYVVLAICIEQFEVFGERRKNNKNFNVGKRNIIKFFYLKKKIILV